MNIRKFLFFLILLTGLISLGACSQNADKENDMPEKEENVAEEGMPIVENTIKLNMMAGQDINPADDWNDILIFNEYENMTNIEVDFELIPSMSIQEKKNLKLASGDYPDAFYNMGLSQQDLKKYGDQGVFIRLNDLIEDYAPNLSALFEKHPEVKKDLALDSEGGIYSFPSITEPDFISKRMAAKPYINGKWLQELGLDMPETTEDFYEYLKAVKDEDPANNDGVPYSSPDISHLLSWLKGSFGIANRGYANNFYDANPDNEEELRFYPISDGYKEMLQYVSKLFNEGLIEQNIFSLELDQFLSNASEGKYGSTNWWAPQRQFEGESGADFVGLPALEGPNGDKEYIGISSSINSLGNFAITQANENPAATVRWIDHFYGDEGAKLYYMGIEGETFEEDEDGNIKYMDFILNDEGITIKDEMNKFSTWSGSDPALTKQEYFVGAETTDQELKAAETLEPDAIDQVLSTLPYTSDEISTLDSIGNDIEKYVTEMQDKFIEGQESFDEWDEYIETIEKMGLDEYMDVQQEAYERSQSID